MLGAFLGDISGSRFEFGGIKSKVFRLFTDECVPTDDSVLTAAVAETCMGADLHDEEAFKQRLAWELKRFARAYPDAGYGGAFARWVRSNRDEPYGSFGNGSAMRVSPVAWAAASLDEAERLAEWSAAVTHNHPEGIKGACAVAAAIYLARDGATKDEIRQYIASNYYDLGMTVDGIRPGYDFDVTCQGSVPQAIVCFLEGESYEDTVRNAISLGGDTDTQAAIAGSIAEAFFGIPDEIAEEGMEFLDDVLLDVYDRFKEQFM